MSKKIFVAVLSVLFFVVLGFVFLSSDDGGKEEFENVKPLSSGIPQQEVHPKPQQVANEKTAQQPLPQETTQSQDTNPIHNNNQNDIEKTTTNPYLLKRQEMELERQRRLEEYKNSPEYRAMEKWRQDYENWRKRTEAEMLRAYESGDMQKFSEIRMKLIREEGAPKRPVFKERQ